MQDNIAQEKGEAVDGQIYKCPSCGNFLYYDPQSNNVVYANGHTKSKLELKRSNQCKSKSRDSLRNLDFLSTYIER